MNTTQEQALREYLQEAIIPLIEGVLVKKIGQAMTFAAGELTRPEKEWQGLTDEEFEWIVFKNHNPHTQSAKRIRNTIKEIEAKLKEKNT